MSTVVIAHRYKLVRAGIEALLKEANFTVVARCAHLTDVLNAATNYDPDVIIMGQDLVAERVATFLQQLKQHSTVPRAIFIFEKSQDPRATEVIRQGVSGVIFQYSTGDRLLECVRNVVEGRCW